MSQRGSFVTEYIDCGHCLEVAKEVLIDNHKYLNSIQHRMWGVNDNPLSPLMLPIISGKLGGMYAGEEMDNFERELIPLLEKRICHPLRIAVLAEVGEKIFTVTPKT